MTLLMAVPRQCSLLRLRCPSVYEMTWLREVLHRTFKSYAARYLNSASGGSANGALTQQGPLPIPTPERRAPTLLSRRRQLSSLLTGLTSNSEHFLGDHVWAQSGEAERLRSRRHWLTRSIATSTQEPSQPDVPSHSCGFSYSQFVRKCSEYLTDRQLERVAMRLKSFKGLKKTPRPHNRLAVLRDIGKIIPRTNRGYAQVCVVCPSQVHYLLGLDCIGRLRAIFWCSAEKHRAELTELLANSLDIVDPHHFLRLSKATAERIGTVSPSASTFPALDFAAQCLACC